MEKLLPDICKIQYGYAFDSAKFSDNKGTPLIRIRDVVRGFSETYTTEECGAEYIVKDGDMLIGMDGVFNIAHWNGGKAYLNQRVCKLMPTDEVDALYLYYFMPKALKAIEDKTPFVTVKHLSAKELNTVVVPMPAMEEQKKIANSLHGVDELIALRKEQLAKLDQLVKSRFVELFGDINTNDKNWDSQPLGELCTIVRGGSPRPIENFLGGEVPWIKIGDATKGDNIYLHSTKEHIIRDGVKKSRMVKSGSLIFANCGVSLGFARIITFDGCIHDGWLAMEDIDVRLDKVFLLQALNQMTDHFRKIAPAGTQPNLNTAIMKAYIQIIPPMELQKEYIAFIEQTDKSKMAIQQSLDKLELLKKSLMQEYFG